MRLVYGLGLASPHELAQSSLVLFIYFFDKLILSIHDRTDESLV